MIALIYLIVLCGLYIAEKMAHKKFGKLLPFLTVLFLIVLMGGNTDNADYAAYEMHYYHPERNNFELLYTGLCKVSLAAGMSYRWFRLITSAIGILLIHSTVRRYVKNLTLFYSIYLIAPFILDVVQVRNFLGMSVFIFAVPWLFQKNTFWGCVKYFLAICVAGLLHKTMFFYLICIVIRFMQNNRVLQILLFLCIFIGIVLAAYKPALNMVIQWIAKIFNDDRFLNYISPEVRFGWIVMWGQQFVNVLLLSYARKTYKMCAVDRQNSAVETALVDFVFWLSILSLALLPGFMLNVAFTRLSRNFSILYLIVYFIAFQRVNETPSVNFGTSAVLQGRKKLLMLCVIVWSFILLASTLFLDHHIYDVLLPIFTDNWIFWF